MSGDLAGPSLAQDSSHPPQRLLCDQAYRFRAKSYGSAGVVGRDASYPRCARPTGKKVAQMSIAAPAAALVAGTSGLGWPYIRSVPAQRWWVWPTHLIMLIAMNSALDLDGLGPQYVDYEGMDRKMSFENGTFAPDEFGGYENYNSAKLEAPAFDRFDPIYHEQLQLDRQFSLDRQFNLDRQLQLDRQFPFDRPFKNYDGSANNLGLIETKFDAAPTFAPKYHWNLENPTAASSYPSPIEDLDQWIPHMTPYTFLVVDDNEINLRILSRMLRKLYPRASVRTVQHSAAVETTEAALLHFDIIFLDIEMPEVSGTELATRVRGLKELDHVALVAVTTRYSSLDVDLYRSVGFDYTFGKPLENHNYIQQKVEQVLRMRLTQ